MSISSVANFASSAATRLPSANCPGCGPGGSNSSTSSSNAARTSTAQAFSGGHRGRTDSFTCVNCGPQRTTVASATTTFRTSANASSAHCPTCVGGSQARSLPFSTGSSNAHNCPTCNRGPTTVPTTTIGRGAATTPFNTNTNASTMPGGATAPTNSAMSWVR